MGKEQSKRFEKQHSRLRLLVIAPSFDILGGQAVQAARLMERLREVPELEVGFLPINPRLPGGLRFLQAIKYVRTLVTSVFYFASLLARVHRYDVIHIFSASYLSFVIAQTPAILISKLFRKKVLLNYHSGEAEDHFTRWRTAIPTIRLVDEVVVPSAYLVRVFAKFGIRARAIHNLIELEQFSFTSRKQLRPVFLSNRNLETHYGVDHVLRAFALIQKQIPDAQLIVAGDGSQRKALEALAQELELRNITFTGGIEHDEITQQYQRADIYLNGSEIDNQPLSILEAFACGLPVVTTNAGGIPDMVEDGVSGFVVARGDHRAMAERALQLLNEPALAESMAQRGFVACEKYTWPAMQELWKGSYVTLAKGGTQAHKSRLGKLLQMDPAELRERLSQAEARDSERFGLSLLTKLPSDRSLLKKFVRSIELESTEDLIKYFRNRTQPDFFSTFAKPGLSVSEFRRRFPEAESKIIAEAQAIVAGKFDLLGFKGLSFGEPINWHLDPVSGKSGQRKHWSRIDYLNADSVGDHKIIWELNRHQYFVRLGQAYWLTKDEQYAETFVNHLNAWMDQNPPKRGINWASSLEVAFRSISWLWAFYFFKHSPSFTAATFTRALKFLFLHARHLETYLSTYFSPNTHLTGEALGLFYLGTLLPEFKQAERWREKGQAVLIEQLPIQIRDDGVYFEQSSYYQRYTTDFYTHLLLLSRLNGRHLGSDVERKLNAMLDHLLYITRPDGSTPLFGDEDGGRLVKLDQSATNDFRAALATGAAMFRRGDYKFVARDLKQETYWLVGPVGALAFDKLGSREPLAQSKAFSNGGYYVMRDGWHKEANYLLFDCGPHGTANCGHAHADSLSIECTAKGQPVLVDSGTYTYTGADRNSFRESRAHNVLLIDGESSPQPDGPFTWKSVVHCEAKSWISRRRFDFVEGMQGGYGRLFHNASHMRNILFLKNDYWLMRDRVLSSDSHELELRFHFAPSLEAEENQGESVEVSNEKSGLQLAVFGNGAGWHGEHGWFSHCYGMKESANVCAFSADFLGKGDVSDELITFMFPCAGANSGKVQVKEVEAIGGRAFEIRTARHCDLIVLRDQQSQKAETVNLISDGSVTWARFKIDSMQALEELLVLNGRSVMLKGKQVVKSETDLEYLVASRIGNRFQLDSSQPHFEFLLNENLTGQTVARQ
jgi:glycosyltransferase involved in cell wall biosynthesis